MTNELMTTNNMKENLTKESYTSIDLTNKENAKKLYNAVSEADILLNDVVGTTINVVDVYVEAYEKLDETTGEVKPKFRTIIFDDEGKTYATGAYGVYNSLKVIFSMFGFPNEWNEAMPMLVKKQRNRNGHENLVLTLV